MTKKLLINYIRNEATPEEELIIQKWISKSPDNEKYFNSLKNLWVSQHLSNERATADELAEIQAITTKKQKHGNSFHKYFSYAAGVILFLSVALNIFFFQDYSKIKRSPRKDTVHLSDLSVEQKHTFYTEKGVKAIIILPDGSKVWLNSDSKIIYPDRFEGDTREVELSGEAFFDVAKNPQLPMVVTTNKNFRVEVFGTKFNIRAYDNDSEAETTLYSGSISIVSVSKKRGSNEPTEVVTRMKPLESCIIRDSQEPVHSKPGNVSTQKAWKEGMLIFESAPMSEVIKRLERWHGTEFIIKDPSIYSYDITARFKSESIVQIMEMLRYCALIDYKIDENKVILLKR